MSMMGIYVAIKSITTAAGRFSHVDLCQPCTKLKILQCEMSYIANPKEGVKCYVVKSEYIGDQ